MPTAWSARRAVRRRGELPAAPVSLTPASRTGRTPGAGCGCRWSCAVVYAYANAEGIAGFHVEFLLYRAGCVPPVWIWNNVAGGRNCRGLHRAQPHHEHVSDHSDPSGLVLLLKERHAVAQRAGQGVVQPRDEFVDARVEMSCPPAPPRRPHRRVLVPPFDEIEFAALHSLVKAGFLELIRLP